MIYGSAYPSPCHGNLSWKRVIGCREPGSSLLARDSSRAFLLQWHQLPYPGRCWEPRVSGGTWRPGLAQWPSFLARRLPLATSCQWAAPLCRICAAIHPRPPGKAKRLVTQGEAYLLHLPRALSFPSSLPLVSLLWLPSAFLLAHLVGFQ